MGLKKKNVFTKFKILEELRRYGEVEDLTNIAMNFCASFSFLPSISKSYIDTYLKSYKDFRIPEYIDLESVKNKYSPFIKRFNNINQVDEDAVYSLELEISGSVKNALSDWEEEMFDLLVLDSNNYSIEKKKVFENIFRKSNIYKDRKERLEEIFFEINPPKSLIPEVE